MIFQNILSQDIYEKIFKTMQHIKDLIIRILIILADQKFFLEAKCNLGIFGHFETNVMLEYLT